MDALKFKHPEHPQTVEIWFLTKHDRRGWAPREDGTYRYLSIGVGTVIVTNSSGSWHWAEYNANDPRVGEVLAEMHTKGFVLDKHSQCIESN